MTERAFENPYPDFSPHQLTGHFDSAGRLTPEFVQRLQNKIWELLQQLEKGLKSSDPGDSTVYTGWAGIALLYLHLFKVFGETSYLHKALEYISRSLKCLNKQGVTFLCGDAGPLAVGAAVYHKLRQEKEAEDCIRRLLQLHPSAVKMDTRMADELLYGRIGYMYALLFVNRQFEEEKIPAAYIQQVSNTVLASGESLARKRNLNTRSPLMYEWYREYYVGPAHGLSGIYYFLMQPDCGVSQDVLQNIVKPSVDYVNQLKFPSGNFPACIDDTRDLLVHWCHGAPGVIYMLIQAYKLYCDQSYLTSILRCSEVVWQRGLLRKGYGLCHGAAGNAYAFLALYNMTQDAKYLFRACMFADWCIDYGEHGCRTPDTPFSLFEGMAGTIYFLADILEPKKSKFPAFEL